MTTAGPLARWPVAEQRASGARYLFLSLKINTELSDSFPHIEVECLQAMPSLAGGWDRVLRLWEKEEKWLMLPGSGQLNVLLFICVLVCLSPLSVGIWHHVSVLSSLKTMCI